jgi:polyisoprenoid-binding protein YceI
MKIFKVRIAVLAASLLALVPAGQSQIPATQAQQLTIRLDAANTKIDWLVRGAVHNVKGTFQLKGGLITFNAATGVADGELLVDVATGQSGNATRDNKMKTLVLEAQKYPTAFFHPTLVTGAIKPGTTQDLTVEGTLNIHGVDHPLTLKVKATLEGSKLTATTHFVVPYIAWGMKDPSVFVFRVSKQVDVNVTAHGVIEETP